MKKEDIEIANKIETEEDAQNFVNGKVPELEAQYGCKVIPMLFNLNDEWIYGWFKSPTRLQIMSILGKAGVQPFFSGELLLQTNLLKESDVRIMNESPLYDELYTGACLAAYAASNKIVYNLAEKKTGK